MAASYVRVQRGSMPKKADTLQRKSEINKRDLPYRFQCGINNSRVSGLIREVREGLVYEKAAIVWCQNDDE
jgi:hypothetical protein